jgi:ribosomal protein S10
VTERITEFKTQLGPGDRRKLDEYVESIRDVERRIQVACGSGPTDLPEMRRGRRVCRTRGRSM